MAEEFVLSVGVDADMSKFRQTLRQELEAAQRQGATVPVGATGGAVGTSVVPPGAATATMPAGVAATASAVQAQTAQAVAATAARAGMTGVGGAAPYTLAPAASPGGPGTAIWDMIPTNGAPAAAVVNPPARRMTANQAWDEQMMMLGQNPTAPGGQRRGGPRRGGMFGGQDRYITGMFIANAAGRMLSTEMEHGSALRMAGSDPMGIIEADIARRQGMADAFPIAGRLGLALNDAFTGGTEPILRTLRDAERQDTRTEGMRRTAAMDRRFQVAEAAAGLRGADQNRFLVNAEFDKNRLDIQDERRKASDESAAKFRQQRDEVDLWYQTTPISQGGTSAEYDRRMQAIQQSENNAIGGRANRFSAQMRGAVAQQQRGLRDIQRDLNLADYANAGATEASRLRAENRPFSASLTEQMTAVGVDVFRADPQNRPGVARRGAQDIAESFVNFARDFGHQQRQMTAQQRVNQRLLDRDPLGARIAAIEGERDEALESAKALPWGFRQLRQASIRRGAAQDVGIERQQDDDARILRTESLRSQRDVSGLMAEGKQYSARARAIEDETENEVRGMRQSKRFSEEEIRLRQETGVNELKTFQRDLLRIQNAGFGTEVAAGSFAPGITGGNTTEPVVQGLKAVENSIKELKAALTGS